MKRLEIKDLHTIEELKREMRETKDGCYSLRLRYMLLKKEWKSTKELNKGIRLHWSIENSLHYVKDVTFKKDELKIEKGNAPEIFSIVRNFSINAFRKLKVTNFQQGIRLFCGEIKQLAKVL